MQKFNQKGFIYPRRFFLEYAKQNIRFSRMKDMERAMIDQNINRANINFSSAEKENSVVFLGDVMAVGKVKLKVDESLRSLIKNADNIVINLETPLCNDEDTTCKKQQTYLPIPVPSFVMKTSEFTRTMISLGVNDFKKLVVNIANNHTFDTGHNGLINTVRELHSLGCSVIGSKESPTFKLSNGKVICGCTTKMNPSTYKNKKFVVQPSDLEKISFDILFVHWGWEYFEDPDTKTEIFSRELVKCRKLFAIIGHGPHLLQKTCILKGKNSFNECPCFYSLGDAIVRAKRPVRMSNPRALSGILCLSHNNLFSIRGILQNHTKNEIQLKDILPQSEKSNNKHRRYYLSAIDRLDSLYSS